MEKIKLTITNKLKIKTMEQNPKSEGKYLFCGETFAKTGITRHLQTHLRQKAKENTPGTIVFGKSSTKSEMGQFTLFSFALDRQ
ncbi:MAG: hypothetical protein LBP85_08520 [Prevotellaceae bacterium]|jgi:hypothetical protein|nr:hypothetical protein [Prevotellaceae bacterium]